ncbi:HAD-IIB family hydrolase [Spiroplasma endosymbiont of Othius punctulatus]|uniref:HAD-IIB family hydrolase n=1 Tax=Spiroplasma endosymbiont of Othius punctulatus TaxID=3066289 RepID=UPI0030D0EF49
MSKVKVLVLDLDGTCHIFGGGPHPGNFEAIKKANEEYGVKVVFATGRPYYAKQNEFEKLGKINDDYFIASFNGANIRNLNTGIEIETNLISAELTKWLWNYIESNKNLIGMSYFSDEKEAVHGEEESLVDYELKFARPNTIKIRSTDVKEFRPTYKFLIQGFTEANKADLEKQGLHVQWAPGAKTAEINAKDINKGYVVDYFAKLFNVNVSEVLAMGDGANDVASLKRAGYGVCPANSGDAAKAAATQISKYTDAEGCVAKTIEELVFNK